MRQQERPATPCGARTVLRRSSRVEGRDVPEQRQLPAWLTRATAPVLQRAQRWFVMCGVAGPGHQTSRSPSARASPVLACRGSRLASEVPRATGANRLAPQALGLATRGILLCRRQISVLPGSNTASDARAPCLGGSLSRRPGVGEPMNPCAASRRRTVPSRAMAAVAALALLAARGGLPVCIMSLIDATHHCATSTHRGDAMQTMVATRASSDAFAAPAAQHDCHAPAAALGCASGSNCSGMHQSSTTTLLVAPVLPASQAAVVAPDSRTPASFLAPPSPRPPRA
jgi:hypothetical protein